MPHKITSSGKSAWFNFSYTWSNGTNVIGIVNGNLQTDKNTVLNLSTVFAFVKNSDGIFISEFFDLNKPLPSQQQSASSRAYSGNNHLQNFGTTNRTTTFYDVVSAEEFDNVLTILNVECTPINDGKISTKTDEQMLGDLMHYIFTGCKLGLEVTVLNDINIPNFGNESLERAAKIKRNEAETLFAALVGNGTLPTSICRLLSDLVSRRDGGREQQNQSQMSIDENYRTHLKCYSLIIQGH